MDDLSAKINQILSDPQALKQIQGLSSMLSLPNNDTSSPVESTSSSDLPMDTKDSMSGDMLSLIGRLAPLMKDINKEDDTTRLLLALRPFLSDERKKKLDQTGKIMKMLKLLPLLKDFSVFDSLF